MPEWFHEYLTLLDGERKDELIAWLKAFSTGDNAVAAIINVMADAETTPKYEYTGDMTA